MTELPARRAVEVETYLGDGLCASFDGWGITLRAPRAGGDHVVYLEPAVLRKLESLVDEVRKQGGLRR